MDWFTHVANMSALFPGHEALAVDMAINGAPPDLMGYGLAYGLNATPTTIPVYPSEGGVF